MVSLYFPPINKLGNVSFRRVCLNAGADFVFTEMIRIEKVLEGEEYQIKKLEIPRELSSKTIVQIICEDTFNIQKGVDKVLEFNPEVFEINYNMGCPQSSLCKNECGGGIVGNPEKVEEVAKELIKACSKHNIKASIKIRLGITRDNITIYENIKRIRNSGINKVYIHGRCLRDSYNKPATYSEISKVIEMFPDMEIIANGDVRDTNSLNKIVSETKIECILVGRAALEDPYIFKELKQGYSRNLSGTELKEKKEAILEFINYAIKDDLPVSHSKSNLAYMTKGCISGAKFREVLNNLENLDKILDFCENL